MVTMSSRPRQGARVLSQRAEDTVVLLVPDSGEYFSLDELGGRIWELCDGTRTVEQIAERITEEYEAPAPVIRADVVALLEDLASAELMTTDG
jgi:coenzyme PQQ biosynthesis protein PqqD